MVRWMMAASIALAWVGLTQQAPLQREQDPETKPAASQPTTRPGPPNSTYRKPEQAEVLRELLRRSESPRGPIRPWVPDEAGPAAESPGQSGKSRGLLLEGTMLVDRPGYFERSEERPLFRFRAENADRPVRTLQILPNQFLEMMERAADAGVTEFIITAEVTSYRGKNYLLLHKVLRRVPNRNLSP